MALGGGGTGVATAAPAAETARTGTPVTAIAGTWAWRDLDEALATSDAPIPVRIAVSGGRPVVVFPGQAPVKGRWTASTRILRVTVPRTLTGTTTVVPVLYVLEGRVLEGPHARRGQDQDPRRRLRRAEHRAGRADGGAELGARRPRRRHR